MTPWSPNTEVTQAASREGLTPEGLGVTGGRAPCPRNPGLAPGSENLPVEWGTGSPTPTCPQEAPARRLDSPCGQTSGRCCPWLGRGWRGTKRAGDEGRPGQSCWFVFFLQCPLFYGNKPAHREGDGDWGLVCSGAQRAGVWVWRSSPPAIGGLARSPRPWEAPGPPAEQTQVTGPRAAGG